MNTSPRLALQRNEAGELVPSINDATGTQDVQVAGTVVSINAKEEINPTTNKSYYRGTAHVSVKGVETLVPVLFAGSTIDNVEKGSTYWLTVRKNTELNVTNFSCGGLRVIEGIAGDAFDDFNALATANTESVATTA